MTRPRLSRAAVAAAAATALLALTARGGPIDQKSKYPVGIKVGDHQTGGIADSGGVTTLSYEDAKKAGLLDAAGDPTRKPDGEGERGTGASFIAFHFFNGVKVKITPVAANGTANGDVREVETTVYVPKKPADQPGATDDEKKKKTDAVINKLGANVLGTKIGGGKLEIVDTPTADPLKNARSTKWSNAAPGPPGPVPPGPALPVVAQNRFGTLTYTVPGVVFNGEVLTADLTTLPVTLLPTDVARRVGLTPVGVLDLDQDIQGSLFTEGYLTTLPGGPLAFEFGYLDVALPADGGTFVVGRVAALINPESDRVVLGANALVPPDYAGSLDAEGGRFRLHAVPGPSVVVLGAAGVAAAAAVGRRFRRPAAG